jgi:hypothetical protein
MAVLMLTSSGETFKPGKIAALCGTYSMQAVVII